MEVIYSPETPADLKNTKGLHLLTDNTPNGKKVQILLEELHSVYSTVWHTHLIDLETDEQKKNWFCRLNPNGRIPVVVDSTQHEVYSVVESSAILVYLQERYDQNKVFGFEDPFEKSQALQWLFFWHSAAVVQGNARHFKSGDVPQAAERFQTEMLRIYSVLENHLGGRRGAERDYLAGRGRGKYSIADMGTWPHVSAYRSLCVPGMVEEQDMRARFPCLFAWIARVAGREAVQRGIDAEKYDCDVNRGLVIRAEV
ncbi:hypothetical protein QQS21_004339 [Conoideocrella luteorostrata]|uniref:Glutathione S-transferase n=1 Tax=Conoideocrella luteorostrata TaxID=1105319 RepID=A0AAJ0CRJ1_9HYPO|nr:hypothetical protein QQS21_004339 [Conoideocrella luteorostrata]